MLEETGQGYPEPSFQFLDEPGFTSEHCVHGLRFQQAICISALGAPGCQERPPGTNDDPETTWEKWQRFL